MRRMPVRVEISHCRTIESLQHAIDQAYRHICETAKADWNRLFAGDDPSDVAVKVRISKDQITEELAGVPRAGFAPKRSKPINGRMRGRPA